MRELAAAGIVAGETGAAGLAGLLALVEAHHPAVDLVGARVLLLLTEGATDPHAYARVVAPE
jgi:diaminopropionate ammonia-lyase